MPGRIPQRFIDDLLDRVDIVDVIDRRVKLKKTGKNYSALCPFHEEKTPSFSVSPDKQFYYCFGCGARGNALGFIMDYESIEFPEAVESLASTLGMEVPREPSSRGPGGTGELAQPAEAPNKRLYDVLERAATYYSLALRKNPQRDRAVTYLKGRGLTGEIARDFGLGFAPPGWDNLLAHLSKSSDTEHETAVPQVGEQIDATQRNHALSAGLLVQNDAGRIYDRFRDRIVFPIRDRRGRVIAFGGRVLGDEKPKYLNSPESPVFHKGRELYGLYEAKRANRHLERLLVVEGYMDVIALAQAGITYAVATLGTATSTEHMERIFRTVPEVVFCFDGDEAGQKAADRALLNTLPVMSDGRQARFLFLPTGEDPDSLVRSIGAEAFLDRAQGAKPLEEYLFTSQSATLDLATMEGRATLSKKVLPLLQELPAGVFRELMFQALADRAGIELESLRKLAANEPRRSGASAPAEQDTSPAITDESAQVTSPARMSVRPPVDATSPPPQHVTGEAGGSSVDATLIQAALALLLHKPSIAQLVEPHMLKELEGREGEILIAVIELLHARPDSTTGMLLGHWHSTPEGELLTELAGQERLIPAEGIEAQFDDIMRKLTTRPLRQRIVREIEGLKSLPFDKLTADDKIRLPELIRALRDLDARSLPAGDQQL